MSTATYHSQIRSSFPQVNYELRGSVLSFNRMIESRPVPPVLIQGFLRHNETKRALSYLESMLDAGFSASASTSTKLVYLLATKDLDKASKEVLKKFFSLWNKKVRCGGKRARRGIRFRSNLCLVANEKWLKALTILDLWFKSAFLEFIHCNYVQQLSYFFTTTMPVSFTLRETYCHHMLKLNRISEFDPRCSKLVVGSG
ncbi:hypothetical protein L2E82_26735 [Cichorium intybus]|uniref:Uncharacterized protein n=1 Tax=Cichorium intybus TaxID=13427 RepID=A0ACB9CR64_CICIN|nr:hypothetical protein L2E82_26735 [Cichorium intybus]